MPHVFRIAWCASCCAAHFLEWGTQNLRSLTYGDGDDDNDENDGDDVGDDDDENNSDDDDDDGDDGDDDDGVTQTKLRGPQCSWWNDCMSRARSRKEALIRWKRQVRRWLDFNPFRLPKKARNSIASCFPALRERKHGIKPNSNFYCLLYWNAPICDLNCFFQWMKAIAAHMGVGTPCARETLLVQLRTCFHAGLRGARAHCGYLCRQSDKRQTVDLGFWKF